MQHKVQIRTAVLVLMILIVAIYRVLSQSHLPAWANFTPLGAMALFAGAYFKPVWKAFLISILILFISDIFINYGYTGSYNPFYGGMLGVYVAFLLITFVGYMIEEVTFVCVFLATIISVLIHWLITDIHPWWNSTPGLYYYSKDLNGYVNALIAAVPFEISFIKGTVLFNVLLFAGFELLKSRFKVLQLSNNSSIPTV